MKYKYITTDFTAPILVLCVVLASLAWAGPAEDGAIGAAETWGENTQVVEFGRLFIASQPDLAALERARESGIETVISLRAETESDWDEAEAAESLGLAFHRVPVDGAAPALARESLERISEIVESDPEGRVLVHCSTGNRASAWLAVYLAGSEGVEAEDAIAAARKTGLTNTALEQKVRDYLAE